MTISSVAHAIGNAFKKGKKKVSKTAHAVGYFASSQYHALGSDIGTVYSDVKSGVSGAGKIASSAVSTAGSSVKSLGNNVEGISSNLQLPLFAGIGLAAIYMLNQN